MSALRTRKSLFYYVILSCLVYASIEGVSWLGLKFLRTKGVLYSPLPSALSQQQKDVIKSRLQDTVPLSGHHPVLGWAPTPNRNSKDGRINSQGIRSDREYSLSPRPDIVRLAAFGDSFTFGSEVENKDTWEEQVQHRDERFEILNFGVGAYGLDQAYLRYLQDGIPFGSDIVVIGFMSENIYRNLNVFRPFYSTNYSTNVYTKPRFSVDKGNLVLLKNPLATLEDYTHFLANDKAILRDIGRHDYHYQVGYLAGPMDMLPSVRLMKIASRVVKKGLNPVMTREGSYDIHSEAFLLTTKLLEQFYCTALQHHSMPLILIYPDLHDLSRHLNHQTKRYEPLLEFLRRKQFRYQDVLEAFVAYDPNLQIGHLTLGQWGHYSPLGNSIIAGYVLKYLNDQGFDVKEHVRKAAREDCSRELCCLETTP